MGTYQQGIHGEFSGRVGNIIGSSWKGMSVMKIRPASVHNPRTPLQQANRGRFAMMGQFLSGQNRLIRIGWKPAVLNTSAFNEAMRYNLAAAVTGEYPDFAIDYNKVKLSDGKLPVPSNLQVTASSAVSFTLNWDDNSSMELAKGTDLLMVGVCDQETGEGYTASGISSRIDMNAVITLPDNWSARQVHVFVFMVSTLGIGQLNSTEHISPTTYAGVVDLGV